MIAYSVLFVVSFCATYLITYVIRISALRLQIVDIPNQERKIHKESIPLLGGVAIFLAFIFTIALYYAFAPSEWHSLIDQHITLKALIGICVGAFFLVMGGFLDDRYSLPPHLQIIAPLCSALSVLFSGIAVTFVRNPFSEELLYLPTSISLAVTFFWVLGIIYTTKILDGLDGLVTGITGIGALVIALMSFFVFVNIPTGMLALVIMGTMSGFLFWNFYPAKIFLGEAGSTLCGYFLAILSIISGSKFATGLLILAIPLLDLAWVIFQRIWYDKRIPFIGGDKRHLHFKLLELGLSQKRAVLVLYACSLAFGMSAIAFQNINKLVALFGAGIIMIIFIIVTSKKSGS